MCGIFCYSFSGSSGNVIPHLPRLNLQSVTGSWEFPLLLADLCPWKWGEKEKVLVAQLCPTLCDPMGYFVTPWIAAHQAPLSMEFSRQEYWSRVPFPPSGDLPDPEIKPVSLRSPALAGIFFYYEHHL